MDRVEVWYSRRGAHVPPAGHGFLVEVGDDGVGPDEPRVHLVNFHHPRGTPMADRKGAPLTTRCDMVLHPADELAVRAKGELCARCADAAGLTEGLEWQKTG